MNTETVAPPSLDDYDPSRGPGGMPWTYRDSIEWSLMRIKNEMHHIQKILDILGGVEPEEITYDDPKKPIPF